LKQQLGYGLESPAFESRNGQEIFLFFKIFRPALKPSQAPIWGELGFFPERKGAGGWSWILATIQCSDEK